MNTDRPSASVLKALDRIKSERRKLWQACGILGTACETANHGTSAIDGSLSQQQASDLHYALLAARELIESATAALEFDDLTERPPSNPPVNEVQS